MTISIELPYSIENQLRADLGDISAAARVELAIAWYQSELLSIGQVAEMLGKSIYEVEGLFKQRGIVAPFSVEDLEHDRLTLQRVLRS